MIVDSKYFSYCKEIGLMKENCSHQAALDCIIKAVKGKRQADPKFVEAVSKLTLSSPEVSVRSCVLYHYDVDLTYVVGGNIKHGRVSDFAQSTGGAPDSLQITNYSGDGSYTVVKDLKTVPYAIYNDKNLFTFEEMKNAMKGLLNKKVPAGTTSYESKDWSVSAYIVPVLTISLKYGNETYYMYYNLQNNRYTFRWVDDPALIAKGLKAKKVGGLIKLASFILPILGFLISGLGGGTSNPLCLFIPIIAIILNIVISNKTKKTKKEFEKFFVNNIDAGLAAAMKAPIGMAVVGFIAMILTIIAK